MCTSHQEPSRVPDHAQASPVCTNHSHTAINPQQTFIDAWVLDMAEERRESKATPSHAESSLVTEPHTLGFAKPVTHCLRLCLQIGEAAWGGKAHRWGGDGAPPEGRQGPLGRRGAGRGCRAAQGTLGRWQSTWQGGRAPAPRTGPRAATPAPRGGAGRQHVDLSLGKPPTAEQVDTVT